MQPGLNLNCDRIIETRINSTKVHHCKAKHFLSSNSDSNLKNSTTLNGKQTVR
jgi:hypothetical protein